MKIVLAGQLDRVYANARARASGDAASPAYDNADGAQHEEDRLLTHRAATLAALSETVVATPDWYPLDDEDEEDLTGDRVHPSFAPGMALTRSAWVALYDDAAGLVKAVDFLGSYSERSQVILDQVDAPDAWVEDDSSRSLQRASIGAAHAYLTELLLQAFLAWQAGAILVIGEADCHLLADVAKFLVEGGRPRPFPIPDLRAVVRPDGALASGRIPDLGFEELTDVEAGRADPGVRAYAHRLQSIVAAPEETDVRARLEAALAADRPAGSRRRGANNDIAVALEHAEILGNGDLRIMPSSKASARYVRRHFASTGLRTIVLIENP
ncbi:hypothetical protein [Methylobacterium sp. 391_Methyba4]|uniref:hypothetical protein n=1 Tax=Methylobacterium sp. 391_Methyba4 TaxID=3038924 RepID=UPI00241F2D56|nr:hypothetical protein [Methylobacterium sp. 391_Methyba4]WFS09597.1 hypothetical protein P9K36_10030 [Methylobacterium sp. 391_Methyba4]